MATSLVGHAGFASIPKMGNAHLLAACSFVILDLVYLQMKSLIYQICQALTVWYGFE